MSIQSDIKELIKTDDIFLKQTNELKSEIM